MKNIITIGGGTGSFTVLSSLKKFNNLNLYAIVSMADDGGSTGKLRDELGVLPPGDVRQCLVALSESDILMRKLFNYRFEEGDLRGHNFGNLFISALEKITGDLDKAISSLENILKIKGKVVPVTLEKTKLMAEFNNGEIIIGEKEIDVSKKISNKNIKRFFLNPSPKINPKIKKILQKADIIIIGPGDLYTSIIPNFLVKGIVQEIKNSNAKKIYLPNLMNKQGHTDNFFVSDFIKKIEEYLGENTINYVLYNNKKPAKELLKKYAQKGEYFVEIDENNLKKKYFKAIGKNLIQGNTYKQNKNDKVKRSLVRHDLNKLGEAIMEIIENKI